MLAKSMISLSGGEPWHCRRRSTDTEASLLHHRAVGRLLFRYSDYRSASSLSSGEYRSLLLAREDRIPMRCGSRLGHVEMLVHSDSVWRSAVGRLGHVLCVPLPGGKEDSRTAAANTYCNGALGADSTSSDVLASAEWLLGALRGEAVLDGESLTTEELRMLRTPVSELSSRNVDRELLQALNDRVVRLARSAIERANRLAKPTVTARPGLRIPADWDRHYKVIFTGNLEWVLSGMLQNAMIGNIGETAPWESR